MATPTVETMIWLALRDHLATLVLSPAVPFIWPGEAETIPQGTSLEVNLLPNRPQRFLDKGSDPHFRQGILQIGVLTMPGAVNHQTLSIEIAGDVAGHFPADVPMRYGGLTVKVSEAPAVGGSFRDKERARWVTPVTVRYHCFA